MPNDDLIISRKPLIEYFEGLARTLANARCFNAADAIQGAAEKLRAAPSVDAEPVRHAKWSKDISGKFVFCSACHESSFMGDCFAFPNRPEITIWQYCPYCGAKMNKEE